MAYSKRRRTSPPATSPEVHVHIWPEHIEEGLSDEEVLVVDTTLTLQCDYGDYKQYGFQHPVTREWIEIRILTTPTTPTTKGA